MKLTEKDIERAGKIMEEIYVLEEELNKIYKIEVKKE